ncbi:MAG: hypothetical protein HOA58_09925 [Rhodospirillaceae bacterium]|jgi:hypothetical protein|nr:hypothetical protein [Rhodospirillaceae bacterium]
MRLNTKPLRIAAGAAVVAAMLMLVPLSAPKAYVATGGQALYEACGGAAPHVCLSYIAGIVDMHEAGLSPSSVALFCPIDAPPEKVGRGIWLYFDQHPEALDQPAALGAVQALALMFPCE